MSKKTMFSSALMLLLLVQLVAADGLSVQLKRTNPGIAGTKSAELIFDVVNTDLSTELEGFLFCKSPDDVTVSSTLGVGSGSGAQYVSPKFNMDKGPSQKAISIVLESEVKGDMRTGCILKYVPFVTETEEKEVYNNLTNQTEMATSVKKQYLKMNGELVSVVKDQDYRELRLDKTVPFAEKQSGVDVACPEGQTSCKAEEVKSSGAWGYSMYLIIGGILLLAFAVVYLIGKTKGN
jgi:hypothetical protein